MSQSATIGGGAPDRRAKLEIDGPAGLQRAPKAAPGVDAQAPGVGRKAPRAAIVLGHHELPDRLAGFLDFRRAHLREILGAQDLLFRHGEARVEIERGNLPGLVARRLEQRVGDAARPGFGAVRLALAGRLRRQHRDQLLQQALAPPEDLERLVEQQAVLMLLDQDRMQRRIEVIAIAEARRLDRVERVEHGARAERHARLAQGAGEMDDVLRQRAAARGPRLW